MGELFANETDEGLFSTSKLIMFTFLALIALLFGICSVI